MHIQALSLGKNCTTSSIVAGGKEESLLYVGFGFYDKFRIIFFSSLLS